MVKHIILWSLKDELTNAKKQTVLENAKINLESLKGKIPGLLEIKVNINSLASSNMDMMLDSSFESEDALKAYASNPAHVEVADNYVRPFTKSRSCLDFEV